MSDKAVGQALRKGGLKKQTADHLVKNKEFARLAAKMVSLMGASLDVKINAYHGVADFSRLPEVVTDVRRRYGRVLNYAVAEGLGLKPKNFSNILNNHLEIRLRYDELRGHVA